jgi:hypothetical protein
MKECNTCKLTKEYTEFHRDKNKKDGLQPKCKSCVKLYLLLYRYTNKDNIKIYQKVYNQTNKLTKQIKYQNNKEYYKNFMKRWGNELQGVYKITSDDLVLYVGQSKQLNYRISKHKFHIKNPDSKWNNQKELYDAINTQYPNYTISIIEECSIDKLIERENYWINELKPILNTLI